MQENEKLKNFVNVLKRKWWFIVLLGILFSSGSAYEKSISDNWTVQSGNVVITKIFTVEGSDKYFTALYNQKFDIDKFCDLYQIQKNMIKTTDGKYDYNEFNLNWKNLNEAQKYDWLQSHFSINDFGLGTYELVFRLNENEPKGIVYIKKEAKNFLNDYFYVLIVELKKLEPNLKIKNIDEIEVYPTEININRSSIIIKYAIIGFLAGCLFGIVILLIKEMSYRNGKY